MTDHAPNSHMAAHTTPSDDDHGLAEEPLGPIDWRAWAAAVLGAASGVVVLVGFLVALN